MPAATTARAMVALAGNPNVGKTSIFNRLTGGDLKVGNYPGITVDRHEGRLKLPATGAAAEPREVRFFDVPGTYSLSSRSREEQIAVQAIAGLPPLSPPDLVVLVVDATQLTRNLYLALQILETGVPLVIALNMLDLVARRGQRIDEAALQRALGVPVVRVSGVSGAGLDELRAAVARVLDDPDSARPGWLWQPQDQRLIADLDAVGAAVPPEWAAGAPERRRALAAWSLLSIDEEDELEVEPGLRAAVLERRRLAEREGREIEAAIIQARYEWIDRHTGDVLREKPASEKTVTERLDNVLLHPGAGFALFLLLMGLVFQSLFSWADPAIGWIETAFDALAGWVAAVVPEGLLRDFITEGLIAGVGSVLVFLPQILLLFFFIGLLEDTGYMARVAFIMDRLMKKIGLHGRAFVPLMSGFACAVPAILATRTMERRRDRMLTMMVLPLMTCSARLPVYALIIGALFPPSQLFGLVPVQGLLMVAMYIFSTVTALVAAAVLGRTLFRGPSVPLILELPPYRLPQLVGVLRMMWQRTSVFLREAGGVILACTVALWLLLAFPSNPELETDYAAQRTEVEASAAGAELEERLSAIDGAEQAAILQQSYGGRLGQMIEPTIAPLGFDWKIGVGIIGAFAAREVFIATMGVMYGVSADVDETSLSLRERIRAEARADGKPVYTPLVGLSLMIFFALACQCLSTLAAVYRETHSWRWPLFMLAYMTALAWVASFIVYQGGRLLGFE